MGTKMFVVCAFVMLVAGCSDSGCPEYLCEDGGTDGADGGETVCTPDESPEISLEETAGNPAPGICWNQCIAACQVLIREDVYWDPGECKLDCRLRRGCDTVTASFICPDSPSLLTVREVNSCFEDIGRLDAWCSSPEECWTSDDWLPDSCSAADLCDVERDHC